MLRDDIDSGEYAVFAELGSSASHMTAARAMDVVARLPACAGQVVDAVPANTHVKMEDSPMLFTTSISECPSTNMWIRFPRREWPKIVVKHRRSS